MQAAQEEARYEAMSEKQIAREIKALEKKMLEHARNLEFEEAARARDQLAELKKRVFGVEAPALGVSDALPRPPSCTSRGSCARCGPRRSS